MRRSTTRTTTTVAGGAVLTAGLLTLTMLPAHAATNWGVDSVHLEPVALTCVEGQALPCVPGSGSGAAGVLQVTQSDDSGEMRFDGLQGTSALGADHVWFGLEVGAGCKGLYTLGNYAVSPERGSADWKYDSPFPVPTPGQVGDPVVTGPGYWAQGVPVPDAKTMPVKQVVLDMAVGDVLGFYDGVPTSTFWWESMVYDQGEAVVAERVAGGMTEGQARATGFHVNSSVRVSGTARCEKFIGGDAWYKRVERTLPLRVEFLPAPAQGAQPHDPATDLATPVEVTDVDLAVSVDPQDDCRLALVGQVHTTGATEVEYRILNPYGQPSNTFTLQVGDQLGAFLRHVDIPGHDAPAPSGDLAGEGPGPDIDGEWAAPVTDESLWSGSFTLEVLSPNAMSDVTGFQVERCVEVGSAGEGAPTGKADQRDPADTLPTDHEQLSGPTGAGATRLGTVLGG
jgi:hypothetical protein